MQDTFFFRLYKITRKIPHHNLFVLEEENLGRQFVKRWPFQWCHVVVLLPKVNFFFKTGTEDGKFFNLFPATNIWDLKKKNIFCMTQLNSPTLRTTSGSFWNYQISDRKYVYSSKRKKITRKCQIQYLYWFWKLFNFSS